MVPDGATRKPTAPKSHGRRFAKEVARIDVVRTFSSVLPRQMEPGMVRPSAGALEAAMNLFFSRRSRTFNLVRKAAAWSTGRLGRTVAVLINERLPLPISDEGNKQESQTLTKNNGRFNVGA